MTACLSDCLLPVLSLPADEKPASCTGIYKNIIEDIGPGAVVVADGSLPVYMGLVLYTISKNRPQFLAAVIIVS